MQRNNIYTQSVNKSGAKLVTLDIPDISTADFLLVAN
jgi:hypothetical protein